MIKKYWPELLVFGFVIVILFIDLNPDYTFINKAADSIGYAYSAKYLYPSFHTSPPLYLLVSHLFLMLPFATEAWRMALFSALSTVVACLFIYLTIKKLLTKNLVNGGMTCANTAILVDNYKNQWKVKIYSLLGVLIYGTSALVISQSIVIQTYAITCMLASGAFYFAVSKKWKLTALFIGMGLVVHLLMFFVAFIMVIYFKEIRKNWKCWAIMVAFLAFYAYIPITNRSPYMWMPDPGNVNSQFPKFLVNIYSFVVDTLSTIGFLIGKLSIWDLPKRILDTIGIVGVGIGVLTIIPIVAYFWKKKFYTDILFWLILTPIILFGVELDMNTFDYTMVAMPFLAIAGSLGLSKMWKPTLRVRVISYIITAVLVGFGIFNCHYFDIGNNLDKNLSASRLYYDEFSKIPDGAILMPNGAWEWEAIFKYNRDYDRHIYPVAIDILPSYQYTDQLKKDGIKLEVGTDTNLSIQARQTAMSIIKLNDNVWTTVFTDPSTFGSKVVLTNHDTSLVDLYDKEYADEIALHPTVKWMPYNPYDCYTTSIMIENWNYVLLSRWNVSLFVGLLALLFGVVYVSVNVFKGSRREIKNER
jgi:hypothetical protein